MQWISVVTHTSDCGPLILVEDISGSVEKGEGGMILRAYLVSVLYSSAVLCLIYHARYLVAQYPDLSVKDQHSSKLMAQTLLQPALYLPEYKADSTSYLSQTDSRIVIFNTSYFRAGPSPTSLPQKFY